MEDPQLSHEEDFCNSILSRFSHDPTHHHLCSVIGATSQQLKDHHLPLSPISYFGATLSSLDLLLSDPNPPTQSIEALLTILSLLLPQISNPILRKKTDYVSELVAKTIGAKGVTQGGVVSGLKCLAHLLSLKNDATWEDVSRLYGILVSFITDDRPKVRRQSHVCLRDVLRSFQGKEVLVLASESISEIFERFLLLAGGSGASASEGPKGAQEVLYILDALKDCLHLMSIKASTKILKYFKNLLGLHQPLVTRRITDCLNALCLHSEKVDSGVLLDLLCLLATSVSANETSVDNMTFTARLLDVGMKKVYSLDRQNCVVKLPIVFSALGDILASEHEEPLFVAMEAFKSLINACIDETMIRQGVDQIKANSNVDGRISGPTVIEKVCATAESLLDYRYAQVWGMSLQVVSAMFDKLGEYSSYLLRGTLKNLADMQNLPEEDFPDRKKLHECVGSALVAMGPETFLSLLPLKLEVPSKANVWLLPILKQYTVGSRLGFFTESILDMVKLVKKISSKLEREGNIQSAGSVDGLVYSLWSLLPSFCNYPLDTAEGFRELQRPLCEALLEEPDLRGIICSSLQILIQQNKRIREGKDDFSCNEISIPKQRALARYTPEFAEKNLSTLKKSADDILPVLSKIFRYSSKDDGGSLQSTISEFASIADKKIVSTYFMRTMQDLLVATRKAGKEQKSKNSSSMQIDNPSTQLSLSQARAQLFDLGLSFLPGLDGKEINALFSATHTGLKDGDGLIQKKAYKVLSVVLKNADGFMSENLEKLLDLMIQVLPYCHFSAKRHRLKCLYFLIVHVSKDETAQKRPDIVPSFLTEILLALKEANKKTRNIAYDVLVQIGHAYEDEEKGGRKENLHQYFDLVAKGLVGKTSHMISAAVKGLARLAYEFSDLVSAAYNVLPSSYLLLQRNNKEIIKANLGLLKVLVAKSQADGLQIHLRSMVEGILIWQDNSKNHFKAKVKLLLEMLVKKCGFEAVKAVMPEEHMKLLTNIRKIKERKEKKLASNYEETKSLQSKATTSRLSRWNHTKIFSDFGDDETDNSDTEYMDTKTVGGRRKASSKEDSLRLKRKRKAAKSLPEELLNQQDDEPLDLLDRQKTRSSLKSSENPKRKQESDDDDEPEIDPEGRLIIREGWVKKSKKSIDRTDTDVRSQTGSHISTNSKKTQKRRKTSESGGWAYTGKEYASKKASGDVKRKDKMEPYAYWPLDRKMVSRRPEQRAAARKGMVSVVKLAKHLEGKSVSSALSTKGLKFKKSGGGGKKKKGSQKKSR